MTKISTSHGTYWVWLDHLQAIRKINDGIDLIFDYQEFTLNDCDLNAKDNGPLLEFLKNRDVKWNI